MRREPGAGTVRPTTMRHHTVRRVSLLSAMLLVPLMWLGAEPAVACSCVRSPLADIADRNDVVASGRLVAREVAGQELEYTFSGEALFKGEAPEEFVVRTSSSSASCGLPGLVVGRSYVLFMDEEGDAFSTTLCDAGGAATPARLSKVEAAAGEARPFGSPTGQPDAGTISVVRLLSAALSGTRLWG